MWGIRTVIVVLALLSIEDSLGKKMKKNQISELADIRKVIESIELSIEELPDDSEFSVGSALHDFVVKLFSTSFPTAVSSNVSEQCRMDSLSFVHGLYRFNDSWARQSNYTFMTT